MGLVNTPILVVLDIAGAHTFGNAPGDCTINGNANRSGSRFAVPGSMDEDESLVQMFGALYDDAVYSFRQAVAKSVEEKQEESLVTIK